MKYVITDANDSIHRVDGTDLVITDGNLYVYKDSTLAALFAAGNYKAVITEDDPPEVRISGISSLPPDAVTRIINGGTT